MTRNEFAVALAVLEAGIGKSLSGKQLEVWFNCLSDLPIESLETAITRYLCEGDDWPSIAKIRKLAGAAMHGECILFGESFDRMISAVRHFGFYDEQKARENLDDLTWRTIKSLGGWEAVCDSPTDQRSTLRAQFRMVYESLRDREEKHRALPEAVRPRIENPEQGKIVSTSEEVQRLSQSMALPQE